MNDARGDDDRQVFRIVVDVLATRAQVVALEDVVGEALCGAPLDHDGPCRVAWTMGLTSTDGTDDDPSYGLDAREVERVTAELAPIEVWSTAEVDRSLGLR